MFKFVEQMQYIIGSLATMKFGSIGVVSSIIWSLEAKATTYRIAARSAAHGFCMSINLVDSEELLPLVTLGESALQNSKAVYLMLPVVAIRKREP